MLKLLKCVNNKNGITLVEIVASIIIFGVVATELLAVFLISKTSITNARYYTRAMNLARARMESIKDLPYAVADGGVARGTASVTTEYPYRSGSPALVDIDAGKGITGNRITQVKPIGDPEQYLEVTVTVTWSGHRLGGGTWQGSQSLVTFISE